MKNGSNGQGHVIWLTGISGSGKTTLSKALFNRLSTLDQPVEMLDGDEVRAFFENDLGYSRAEREANVRRIAFAAYMLAKNGVTVIVANIAPYCSVRNFIRAKLPNYLQVYVKVPLETAQQRDVKGHYKNFKQNSNSPLIGVDDVYEEPRNPDLVVETNRLSELESTDLIYKLLQDKKIIP